MNPSKPIKPKSKEPAADLEGNIWKPYKKGFLINQKGQIKTDNYDYLKDSYLLTKKSTC